MFHLHLIYKMHPTGAQNEVILNTSEISVYHIRDLNALLTDKIVYNMRRAT